MWLIWCIKRKSEKENLNQEMELKIIQLIHITMFFLLSISLYMVVIPSKQEFVNYKKSRRILGFAFMMIVTMEILRLLFPPAGLKRFLDLVIIIVFSFSFTSLVFISFLYMIEAPRPTRQMIKKISLISLILLISLGFTGYIFIDIRPMFKATMTLIYLIICTYQFVACFRTYDKLQIQMELNHMNQSYVKWLHPMLWLTALCALVMGCAFLYKPLYIISSIMSIIVYTVLTMKILSFIPANYHAMILQLEENRKNYEQKMVEEDAEEVQTKESDNEENAAEAVAVHEKKNGYAKIEPLLKKWVENEMYTNAEISIKDAASQMGTNSNYLSQYINKELNSSFATWLNTLRIEKSKEYLNAEERISIEECGAKVGYPNIYNFSRWFKIVTGMSPSLWRKLHQ